MAMNSLGFLFAERGERLDEAVRLIQKALEAEPENGAYLDSLGWAYHKQGKSDLAVRYLEQANERQSGNSEILEHLGDAHLKAGNPDRAMTLWQEALEAGPGNDALRRKIETRGASQARGGQ